VADRSVEITREGGDMAVPEDRIDVARDDALAEHVRDAASLWWLLLLGAVASLVIGVLLLVWPSRTLEVIAILIGIELLLAGAIQLGLAFGQPSGSRTGPVVSGAVAAIAGLIVMRHPGGSLLVIALAVGIFFVLAGVMKLVSAFDAVAGRGWLLVSAVVDLAVGVVIVAWPSFGVSSLAVLLGIVLVVRGLIECVGAFALRSAHKAPASSGAGLPVLATRL
jgi:uncharacterized membrane protein HdeD (DUF308 family)